MEFPPIDERHDTFFLTVSEREPMPWATRVQIALDSARGLEYIHEHTVPVYIHRDIKSANILIDQNYHAKVALHLFFTDFHCGKHSSVVTGPVICSYTPGSRFWIGQVD